MLLFSTISSYMKHSLSLYCFPIQTFIDPNLCTHTLVHLLCFIQSLYCVACLVIKITVYFYPNPSYFYHLLLDYRHITDHEHIRKRTEYIIFIFKLSVCLFVLCFELFDSLMYELIFFFFLLPIKNITIPIFLYEVHERTAHLLPIIEENIQQ